MYEGIIGPTLDSYNLEKTRETTHLQIQASKEHLNNQSTSQKAHMATLWSSNIFQTITITIQNKFILELYKTAKNECTVQRLQHIV